MNATSSEISKQLSKEEIDALIAMYRKDKESIEEDKFKFVDDPDYLLDRYAMILGTDCCLDRYEAEYIKCSNLKHAAPNAFGIWQKNPGRFIIAEKNIVFDPTRKIDQDGRYYNLYTGIKTIPKATGSLLMLEHMRSLCGNNDEVVQWLERWIAYPLQHPGAKLKSCVFMHGPQGAGKNIFWDVIRDIYGQFGFEVTQTQVESEYTDWMSKKLFIIANEVSSRRERKHVKGVLKNLITGDWLIVNKKFHSITRERNHCNLVFLSNEPDGVDTDRSDRRHMVINADTVFSEEYYTELAKNVDIEALYHYFLNVDLGDFHEHTKPLHTADREALQDLNSRSDQIFVANWLDDDIEMFEKKSVPEGLLYWAYKCWCGQNGEYAVSSKMFTRTLVENKVRRSTQSDRPRMRGGDQTGRRITMVWVGEPKTTVDCLDFMDYEQTINRLKRDIK